MTELLLNPCEALNIIVLPLLSLTLVAWEPMGRFCFLAAIVSKPIILIP